MNARTSKLLRRHSAVCGAPEHFRVNVKKTKRHWNSLPRNQRQVARVGILQQIEMRK